MAGLTKRSVWVGWLLVFILKLLFSYFFFQLHILQKPDRQIGAFSFASGDNNSYLGAMENYIRTGNYFFVNKAGDTVTAGRPPHYTIPYWLSRQLTSRETAADIMTVSTILIESFAILCMALIAAGISAFPKRAFLAALILGTLSCYVSNWSFQTLPDAPGASLFMIGFYFYWKAFENKADRPANIFLSSLFLSWAIMLRPFIIVIAAVMALIFLLSVRTTSKAYLRIAIMALVPMILIMGPWLFRNYMNTGKVVPFQQDIYAGYGYKPSELASRRLMTAIGEDGGTFWDPSAMASYFSPDHYRTSTFQFSPHLRKDSGYIRQIESVKDQYIQTFYVRSADDEKKMVQRMRELRLQYISRHGLHFYLVNPLRRVLKFWGHSGSYYISAGNTRFPIFIEVIKFSQSILYYLVLVLGTAGLYLFSRKKRIGWTLLLPIIFLTIFFPVLNGFMEPRYALVFYYPGLIGLIYLLDRVWNSSWASKYNIQTNIS